MPSVVYIAFWVILKRSKRQKERIKVRLSLSEKTSMEFENKIFLETQLKVSKSKSVQKPKWLEILHEFTVLQKHCWL